MSQARRTAAGACALLVVSLCPAAAQDDRWQGQITPYVWASGVGGDITPFAGAPTISFDKSFSDVLEDSDGAFFLSGFARKGRFVLQGDFSSSSSSKSGLVPPGVSADGGVEQQSLTLLAGYRAVAEDGLTLDVLGGARFWHISGSVQALGGAVQRSKDLDFVDPVIALRANVTLAPRWSAILYADVGGFGVGSDQTSQLLAVANYQVSDRFYVSGGLRRLHVDYRDAGTRLDVTMAGPILGLTWRF
ncbi:MAG: hypothetical protein ACT4OK_11255 [Gemmobacter sp.]